MKVQIGILYLICLFSYVLTNKLRRRRLNRKNLNGKATEHHSSSTTISVVGNSITPEGSSNETEAHPCTIEEEDRAYKEVHKCYKNAATDYLPDSGSILVRCNYWRAIFYKCDNKISICYNNTEDVRKFRTKEICAFKKFLRDLRNLHLPIPEDKCNFTRTKRVLQCTNPKYLPTLATARCTSQEHIETLDKTRACYKAVEDRVTKYINDTASVCNEISEENTIECVRWLEKCYSSNTSSYLHQNFLDMFKLLLLRWEIYKFPDDSPRQHKFSDCEAFGGNFKGRSTTPRKNPCGNGPCGNKPDAVNRHVQNFASCVRNLIHTTGHPGSIIIHGSGNKKAMCQMYLSSFGQSASDSCIRQLETSYPASDRGLTAFVKMGGYLTLGSAFFLRKLLEDVLKSREKYYYPWECVIFQGLMDKNNQKYAHTLYPPMQTIDCQFDEKKQQDVLSKSILCYKDVGRPQDIAVDKDSPGPFKVKVQSRRRLTTSICRALQKIRTCERRWLTCFPSKMVHILTELWLWGLNLSFAMIQSKEKRLPQITQTCCVFSGTNCRGTITNKIYKELIFMSIMCSIIMFTLNRFLG